MFTGCGSEYPRLGVGYVEHLFTIMHHGINQYHPGFDFRTISHGSNLDWFLLILLIFFTNTNDNSQDPWWVAPAAPARGINPSQKPAFAFQDARLFLQKALDNEQAKLSECCRTQFFFGDPILNRSKQQLKYWRWFVHCNYTTGSWLVTWVPSTNCWWNSIPPGMITYHGP